MHCGRYTDSTILVNWSFNVSCLQFFSMNRLLSDAMGWQSYPARSWAANGSYIEAFSRTRSRRCASLHCPRLRKCRPTMKLGNHSSAHLTTQRTSLTLGFRMQLPLPRQGMISIFSKPSLQANHGSSPEHFKSSASSLSTTPVGGQVNQQAPC